MRVTWCFSKVPTRTLHPNGADGGTEMKVVTWAVGGWGKEQGWGLPGGSNRDAVPTPGPGGKRDKWCHLSSVRGCHGTGNNSQHPVSCPSIYCWSKRQPPRGPGSASRRWPRGTAQPRRGPGRIWRMTSTTDSIWSKVCVCLFYSFTSIYLVNTYGVTLTFDNVQVLGMQWWQKQQRGACGPQRLHSSQGRVQIIKKRRQRMVIIALQTIPPGWRVTRVTG